MPSYPKNYPFYSWMPKPLGIIILLFFFLPILTVGGVYSVNSTEMMSGTWHYIRAYPVCQLCYFYWYGSLCSFPISVGVCAAGEDDVYCRVCVHVYIQLYLCKDRQRFSAGAL